MAKSRKKVLLVANAAWYLYNFRLGVIRRFRAYGFETVAVAPSDAYAERLRAHGCRTINIDLNPRGLNPLSDARYFWHLYKIYSDERPSLVIHYTIKPNGYGSLAAGLQRVPSVAVVIGAGRAFAKKGWLNRVAKLLLRASFRFSPRFASRKKRGSSMQKTERSFLPKGYSPQKNLIFFPEKALTRSDFALRLPTDARRRIKSFSCLAQGF